MTSPDNGGRSTDEDDHDLLTFGEVAARLGTEIADLREYLSEATEGDPPDAKMLAVARARLAALEEAARRNSAAAAAGRFFQTAPPRVRPGRDR
jgi:DNA-binding transcriptional MerR regulator